MYRIIYDNKLDAWKRSFELHEENLPPEVRYAWGRHSRHRYKVIDHPDGRGMIVMSDEDKAAEEGRWIKMLSGSKRVFGPMERLRIAQMTDEDRDEWEPGWRGDDRG